MTGVHHEEHSNQTGRIMSVIAGNLLKINEQIRTACLRSGRDADRVSVIGVTKTVPVEPHP